MSMKQALLSVMVASSISGAAAAAEGSSRTELKQGVTYTTAVVAGAILGGPAGMFAGALGGAYLGEQIGEADKVRDMTESLAQANQRAEDLQQQLVLSNAEVDRIQQFALDILDTRVLFSSGSDELTEPALARVNALAKVLRAYPQMRRRLDGHTDPRGTDEYNNVLSHYRAESVRQALTAAGVSEDKIELYSHGSDGSRAAKGDTQAYAAERRVEIRVTHPRRDSLVMN